MASKAAIENLMPQNSPFAALFNGPPGDWQQAVEEARSAPGAGNSLPCDGTCAHFLSTARVVNGTNPYAFGLSRH
jgi:hypothetical protein